MRLALIATAITATVMGATVAAGAARAQDGAAARDLMTPAIDRLRVVDMDQLSAQHSVAIAHRLRLRMIGVTTTLPTSGVTRLHGRYATAMVDFFPLAGTGFHLSAGTRFHMRRDVFGEADAVTRGLLYVPRGAGGPPRAGFKRFQPVMTTGYAGALSPGLSLGIEAGVRMGRSFTGPRMPLPGAGWQGQARTRPREQRPNPMVNAILGLRF